MKIENFERIVFRFNLNRNYEIVVFCWYIISHKTKLHLILKIRYIHKKYYINKWYNINLSNY